MSDIVTIEADDVIADSRAVINQNFENLNTDKAESSDVTAALATKSDISHTHTGVYEPANANIQSHIANTSNPHSVTKSQVGLGNADNTSDASKPVSTAQQTALDLKQNALGFTPENSANKSSDVNTDQASTTKYATVKAIYDWAVSLFVQKNSSITGATKTKITYDSKGLVTAGADATTADIADSTNKRYVTDANLTTIGNQSGTNTGDETLSSIKSKLGISTLSGANTGDETTTTAGSLINGATSKATPVDADYVGLMDSAASNILKKLSWANIKATLKTYFDTLYAPVGATTYYTWSVITGTTKTCVVNEAYLANNAAQVVFTLPSTAAVGDKVAIRGMGAGGWKLAQNASQLIIFTSGGVAGTNQTTTGVNGYVSSNDTEDLLELVCAVANTTFRVVSSQGNLNID